MPRAAREKRVTPGAWRTTQRARARRPRHRAGRRRPRVAASPRRERRCASAVGSLTGSLANGVSRFSRLFSDQVWAAPDAVTMRAEARVGDDVHPGQRRLRLAVEHDDVLAAVVARSRRGRCRTASRGTCRRASRAAPRRPAAWLVTDAPARRERQARSRGRSSCCAQVAAFAATDGAGDRRQQDALGLRQRLRRAAGRRRRAAASMRPRPVVEQRRRAARCISSR